MAETVALDTSEICLACGMCCRGVIFPDALLDVAEFAKADRFGLPVVANAEGRPAFSQPCRLHVYETNECSVYSERFDVCRRYRCDLLEEVEAGHVDTGDAVAVVREAHACEARIYRALGGRDPSKDIWTAIADHITASGIADERERTLRFAGLLLEARLLSRLLNRHFERRLHRRINVDTDVVDAPGMSGAGTEE